MNIYQTLDDNKTKMTILSFCFLFLIAMGISNAMIAIGHVKDGAMFWAFINGIAPGAICFGVAMIIVWIVIRDFFLKSAKRMKPRIVYSLIMGFAVGLVIMGAVFALAS